MSHSRLKGKVTRFDDAKGFGFIQPDDGQDSVFVHYTHINMGGHKTLKTGDIVEFDIGAGREPGTFQAKNVRKINEAPPTSPLQKTEGASGLDHSDIIALADSIRPFGLEGLPFEHRGVSGDKLSDLLERVNSDVDLEHRDESDWPGSEGITEDSGEDLSDLGETPYRDELEGL